jgi:hypothetical protein
MCWASMPCCQQVACHAGSSTYALTFSATRCTEGSAELSAARSPPTVRPPEAATAGPSSCSHLIDGGSPTGQAPGSSIFVWQSAQHVSRLIP